MSVTKQSIWDFTSLPADTKATHKRYREALNESQAYLSRQFHAGIDVGELVHQRAAFIDEMLQHIWTHYVKDQADLCLVAVGGYGRGHLHPHSDIDVLILLDDAHAEAPPEFLSDFMTQLWDTGLEIGHSVRTLDECREQAEDDIATATNLLEARHLAGDVSLYQALEELTDSSQTWDTRRFFEHKRQEQIERHQKYKDSANNLEPNIKESPGGLRDIQVINWVAQKHFEVDDLDGLFEKGFITQRSYEKLENAQNFLWKIRFALHDLAGRKQDKLMIDYQRQLATVLGYEPTEARLAVELFMKDYYRCARSVRQMNSLLMQLFEEEIILADEASDIRIINRRFQVHNGYLETINPGIFAYFPYALLEVFLILEQNPDIKGIRASTIRQIHSHLHLIDDSFRNEVRNRSLFMEIIRQPKGLTHEFRRMNELGVLGAYLPEFGQIVGQMQHDLFHAYTVDEHTLFLVGNLRRFSCEEFYDELPRCSEVFKELPKPELLYIAGIYHDIAKGRGGDHSILGVDDAKAFGRQHNLSPYDTELICFLVRHHLAMSSTAQKSDIDDPDVIDKFADLVQTTERLNYLYLLTVADIRATNGELWNSWRDSLLRHLYNSTRQWIEHKDAQAKNTTEVSIKQYQRALAVLLERNREESDVVSIWQSYDSEYFLRHSVDQLVWQTETRLDSPDVFPLISIRKHYELETIEIFIVSQDRPGIFAAITSGLEQCQLNVLDAKINVTETGEALNTFIVNGPTSELREIVSVLKKCLAATESVKPFDPVITPRMSKLFKTSPTISFKNPASAKHTLIQINTHDRPGLISKMAQGFLKTQTQIINAKINTLGDQVEDVFIITTDSGQALSHDQQAKLKQALTDILSE